MFGSRLIRRLEVVMLAIASSPPMAQQSGIPGWAMSASCEPAMASRMQALRQGLRDFGYLEGNGTEVRYAVGFRSPCAFSAERLAQR